MISMQRTVLVVNEREKEVAILKKKDGNGDVVVDAVVKEDASIKNGDGNKSEVKDSAAGTVRNGKPIKCKKLATKALLKVNVPLETIAFCSCFFCRN